jgi:hypothetical protein
MKREKLAAVFFAAAIVFGLAASAGAVDGTIEINQATVLAAGGFPYHININPGTYRLTGNLTVPSGSDGIVMLAHYVTIDLNGFSITGGGTSGTNLGILGNLTTTVENGTVTGFADGIVLGANSIVKSVHADSNGQVGISTGDNAVIEGCTANSNSGFGIKTNNGSVIEGSTANSNATTGIFCGGTGCMISGNTANNNGSAGVQIQSGPALILRNTIISTTMNSAVGISAPNAQTGYGENVLNGFGGGYVVGGTSMKNNVCGGVLC